jgi:type III restriction enzyme
MMATAKEKIPAAEAEVGLVTDQNPIISDPYREPTEHWEFGEGAPEVKPGRREAGYIPPAPKGEQLSVTDELIRLPHVNVLRERVKRWREDGDGYQGATQVTKELFREWFDPERELKPFFAQREAMETIAFLTEAPSDQLQGIELEGHEDYGRWAVKLATGAGKTLVMAMVIAWSGINKRAKRQDRRFADAFLVVCPNLTVKERLRGKDGILPSDPDSAFSGFELIPGPFASLFGEVRVMVVNWHQLAPKEDRKFRVLKRGPESDAAFARRVLADLGDKRRIMVLNDEAHHAWRPPPDLEATGEDRKEAEQATVWIDGLARIHGTREVLRALDFSATPMYPGAVGGQRAWRPFEWVVSDFGLVDAIESGLVKVPRIPTDDDAGYAIPKYRNLWEHLKNVAPKRGDDPDDEGMPVYDYLADIDGPLQQLVGQWEATLKAWLEVAESESGGIPPVMIIVCNEIKLAQTLEKYIAEKGNAGPWFQNRNGEPNTVRIDSGLLDQAEAREEGETAADAAERLREIVATVGKPGQPGEQVRCLISVGMLSEGWDARNVTQILGLRAFQSQLLCEQVVGRGLRRTDYSDLSKPEFVDVYGVPFQLLPFVKASSKKPIQPPKTTRVHSLRERQNLRLRFPRVEQIIQDVDEDVEVDLESIEPIRVSRVEDPTETFVEFEVGAPGRGIGGMTQDREASYRRFRRQRLIYRIAAEIVNELGKPWLFPRFLALVNEVVEHRVEYEGGVDHRELGNLRYVTQLKVRTRSALRSQEHDRLIPVLNEYERIGSTDCDFQTVKECVATVKSHISHVVCDSRLEAKIAQMLEEDDRVVAYAKNDRLFFEIPYRHLGKSGRYRPDFLAQLENGVTLVLEGKGRRREKDDAKLTAANRWLAAVNGWGELGQWDFGICFEAADAKKFIDQSTEPSTIGEPARMPAN